MKTLRHQRRQSKRFLKRQLRLMLYYDTQLKIIYQDPQFRAKPGRSPEPFYIVDQVKANYAKASCYIRSITHPEAILNRPSKFARPSSIYLMGKTEVSKFSRISSLENHFTLFCYFLSKWAEEYPWTDTPKVPDLPRPNFSNITYLPPSLTAGYYGFYSIKKR